MIDALDAIPTGGGNPINQVATVVQTARNHPSVDTQNRPVMDT
jgi:hypothetical protein